MTRFAIAFALATLPASLPVAAQDIMPRTPQSLVQVASAFGTAAIDTPDGEGRPIIRGMIDGTRYGMLVYGCEGMDGCDSIQFFASFDTPNNDLAFLNQWNMDKRFGSAYRDGVGDVILHYNVNIDFGVSTQNFEDTMDIWRLTLNQFVNRLNGLPDDGTAGGASK